MASLLLSKIISAYYFNLVLFSINAKLNTIYLILIHIFRSIFPCQIAEVL